MKRRQIIVVGARFAAIDARVTVILLQPWLVFGANFTTATRIHEDLIVASLTRSRLDSAIASVSRKGDNYDPTSVDI